MTQPTPDEIIKRLAIRIIHSVHIAPDQHRSIMEVAESFADEIAKQRKEKNYERG